MKLEEITVRKSIEYYLDSMESWQKNLFGATRIRGLIAYPFVVIIVPAFLVSTGEPWWWASYSNDHITISYNNLFLGILVVLLFVYLSVLLYLRNRGIVSSRVYNQVHNIAHFCRDFCLFRKQERDIILISNYLCEMSQKLFIVLLKGDVRNIFRHNLNINVVIRLASSDDQQKISYSTVGRSSGLNQNRNITSKPLGEDEGITKLIITENSQGVVLLNDLKKAESEKIYTRSKNDIKYQNEVRSKAIAPLNGWDGEKRAMIGVLVITSSHRNTLKHKHVDLIATIADIYIYAGLFSVLINSRILIPYKYTVSDERRKDDRRKSAIQIEFFDEKRFGNERRTVDHPQ